MAGGQAPITGRLCAPTDRAANPGLVLEFYNQRRRAVREQACATVVSARTDQQLWCEMREEALYSSGSDEIIHRYSPTLIAAMQTTPSATTRKRV